jgi:hypothetical protein
MKKTIEWIRDPCCERDCHGGPLLLSFLDQHSARFYFADTCQSWMTTVMLPRTNVALCEVRPAQHTLD